LTKVVLDASALMALLRREPGADLVHRRLADSLISAVNYSEVLKKSIERQAAPEVVRAFVRNIALPIIPFDAALAVDSASLYPTTKAYGMSFADRACLALGIRQNAEVLTTEAKMAEIELPIKVTLIRKQH
jgi:ribonuclease VapC